MNLLLKILIAIAVAAAAGFASAYLSKGMAPDATLLLTLALATVATVLLTSLPTSSGPAATAPREPAMDGGSDEPREQGEVKWFNSGKGFGFITKDDGEEIFVHFRAIRGEGRRSLKDGQRVSFVVANTDKGPQAEDVTAL